MFLWEFNVKRCFSSNVRMLLEYSICFFRRTEHVVSIDSWAYTLSSRQKMDCNERSVMRKEKDDRHISTYMNYVNLHPGV